MAPTESLLSPTSSALASRRLSSNSSTTTGGGGGGGLSVSVSSTLTTTSNKPLIRPLPHSSNSRSPPSSPSAATQRRFPSPPPPTRSLRPKSVLGGKSLTGSTNGAAHPQQHAQHNLASLGGPSPDELIKFASLCRALYYDKDAGAAQAVDSTLSRLPFSHRTPFARVMASIRSQFHRDEEIRRRKLVEDALERQRPGAKVMSVLGVGEGGRKAMRSGKAWEVRRRGVEEFVKGHCLKGLPGTQPFFRGLYALLYLQSLDPKKGGAGPRRVEWEVDVTVFSEAGGGNWLEDSIEVLKSILGCTEEIKEQLPSATTTQQSYFDERDPTTLVEEEGQEEEVESDSSDTEASPLDLLPSNSNTTTTDQASSGTRKLPPKIPPHRQTTLRTRSTSDPFLDPGDRKVVDKNPLTPSPPVTPIPSSSSPSSSPSSEVQTLLSTSPALPSTTTSPTITRTKSSPLGSPAAEVAASLDASPPPQIRIFTLPSYLTDPELSELCSLFPDFITSKVNSKSLSLSHSSITKGKSGSKLEDLERSGGEGVATGRVVVGHGEIRIGKLIRDEGWRGTGWQRFLRWLRRCFGRR